MTAPLSLADALRIEHLARLDRDCETRRKEPLSDHPAAKQLEAERQAIWRVR